MSALGRVRGRLAAARNGILALRPEFKSLKNRQAMAHVVKGLEDLMDYADEHFDNHRAKAAAKGWRDAVGQAPAESGDGDEPV